MVSAIKFGGKSNLNQFLILMFLVISGLNLSIVVCDENLTRDFFVKQLFLKYGSDETITLENFRHLLSTLSAKPISRDKSVITQKDFAIKENDKFIGGKDEIQKISSKTSASHDHDHDHDHDHVHEVKKSANKLENALVYGNHTLDNYTLNKECLSTNDILTAFGINVTINKQQFINLCPAIIYKLGMVNCDDRKATEVLPIPEVASNMVWLYAAVAVLIISLSGLVVVAIIPVLRGAYYKALLQFLVALAVGSLIGDALLHLLPHALSGHDHRECETGNHDHTHGHELTHDSHCEEENHQLDMMVWKGVVAVLGIFIFFMAERLLTVCSTRRKNKFDAKPKKFLENGNHEANKDVEEKLCKQKYNSYSYCYGEVTVDMLKGLNEPVYDESDHHNCLEKSSQTDEAKDSFKQPAEEMKTLNPLRPKIGDGDHFEDGEATTDTGVIRTQHEHRRHGHSHTHTHTVPTSVTSVACMVIMGDGLHNFSDGLAIGASFANSITGGVSTAIAVFCHELPHELGDFAVLLKSGMTAKQALAYNGLSSVLCFLGMIVGVGLGNLAEINSWVFAGAAGMFIYIALVDMIPELNSTTSTDYFQLFLQCFGMFLGVVIMLLIALHEHDLQKIFHYN